MVSTAPADRTTCHWPGCPCSEMRLSPHIAWATFSLPAAATPSDVQPGETCPGHESVRVWDGARACAVRQNALQPAPAVAAMVCSNEWGTWSRLVWQRRRGISPGAFWHKQEGNHSVHKVCRHTEHDGVNNIFPSCKPGSRTRVSVCLQGCPCLQLRTFPFPAWLPRTSCCSSTADRMSAPLQLC